MTFFVLKSFDLLNPRSVFINNREKFNTVGLSNKDTNRHCPAYIRQALIASMSEPGNFMCGYIFTSPKVGKNLYV